MYRLHISYYLCMVDALNFMDSDLIKGHIGTLSCPLNFPVGLPGTSHTEMVITRYIHPYIKCIKETNSDHGNISVMYRLFISHYLCMVHVLNLTDNEQFKRHIETLLSCPFKIPVP